MAFSDWFSSPSACKDYKNQEQLFHGLRDLDNQAILCLQIKALPMVRKSLRKIGLDQDKLDEVLNESTLVFLQKIENGSYEFKGHALTTYLVEVAKRIAMSKRRRTKPEAQSLDDEQVVELSDFEEMESQAAAADLVQGFLSRMDQACRQVIQLYHIKGYKDEEVIQLKLTSYSSINSLKVKRSNCMKKLIEIAQQWKTMNHS